MGFLKSFFGAMAAAEINEKKREAKERERAQKAEHENEQKIYRLEMSFFDYLEKINCVNASFDDYEKKRLVFNDPWEVTRIIDGLKAKLKEYMSFSGNPVFIYDFEKMDLYIEIVKRLKEYGWIDKQDQYVKYADDTYFLDSDWEREQKRRHKYNVQVATLLNATGNEISEVIKKGDNGFIPYNGHSDAIVIDIAKSNDETIDSFLDFLTVSLVFTDQYILVYNYEHDELYYKADVQWKNVEADWNELSGRDWSLVEINGLSLLFNTEKAKKVVLFYGSHNVRVAEAFRDQYNGAYENINCLSGVEFELVCKRLLENMGFDVETTKTTGDGGIDLIAYNHQPMLLGKYIIQCKRYTGSVGEPVIRDLYGVITSERANKGILITTGHFTKSATAFAENKPLELIDGAQLKVLIKQYLRADSGLVMPTNQSTTSIVSSKHMEIVTETGKGNFADYLFYSPNNIEIAEVQENPNFIPFGYEELYRTVVSRLSINPGNLSDTGHMISLLQDYIYNDKSWLWGDVSTDDLHKNKRDALKTVLNVSQNLRSNKYLYLLYLSISAQSHFMLGNWKNAIRYYEELLSQPEVLVEAVHKTMYSGELELAAKIVHNICLILASAGKEDLAVEYRAKYEYIFNLEKHRTERLISKNPHLKDGFEKAWKRLSDTSSIKDFYFDLTLAWGYDVDGDGMLVAICKDCENRGEVKKASFDNAKEIQFLNNGSVAIMDYETGDSDGRVLIVQLQD